MTTLVADGYLSDSGRTEAEMQTALDDVRNVIAEIGSTAAITLTISSDAISTVPVSPLVKVQSEGYLANAADTLNTINQTTVDQGRRIILRNYNVASTDTTLDRITVTHDSSGDPGTIRMADNADFMLCGKRQLMLIKESDYWTECWRSYGRRNADDIIAERDYLGLGTSAVENLSTGVGASANSTLLKVASGADLAENDILALDASGNIVTGTVTGGNADTLDSLDSTAFVRATSSSAQDMIASLTATTAGATRIAANTTGSTAGFSIQDDGTQRGSLLLDTSNGIVQLGTEAAGVDTPSIRLNPSTDALEFSPAPGVDAWESLRPGAGNGLDADTLDGLHASDIFSVLSIVSGDGGSFRLYDGTTTLLVQWPSASDWVDTLISQWSAYGAVWTFDTAYSSVPVVLGGGLAQDDSGVYRFESWVPYTTGTFYRDVNTTDLQYLDDHGGVDVSLVGIPIVIGEPVS